MANTKLRKIQFYRNGQEQEITNLVDDLKSAYVYAEASFKQTGKHNEMEDGEILLYRFSYDGQVHTLVGVVHATVPQEGEQSTKTLEVLANYDMLGAEISNEIDAAINALDVENVPVATETDGIVTFNGIKQENGKIATGTTGISLAKVATTGTAADVKVVDTEGVITAETVEGALVEIAKEINAMDYAATDVVVLNEGKTALQAGKISETDGKIAVGNAANVVEFNQALSDTNKVATMADVADAAKLAGKDAIEVKPATGIGATGNVVSLEIDTADKVLSQNETGLLAHISLSYDSQNKVIKLLGKNETIEGQTSPAVISEINANDFIKDGMLESAVLVETAEEDVTTEAPYLKFTWNTDAGSQITRISVKKFIDTYTSGNNETLTVSGYTITPKTEEIAVGKTGLAVAGDVATAIAATKGQDIQTITGETATTQGNYIDVKVTATKDANNNYTLSTTSNVTTQAVSTATSTANGLATASDVKTYVDAKVGSAYTATGELEMSTGREITHKESGVITPADNPDMTSKKIGGVATGENNTATITVPVIEVNAYGHVIRLEDNSYTVTYPTSSVVAGNGIAVTPSTSGNNTAYTVGVKLNSNTNDMLTVDGNGLNLNSTWDCGEYL